MSLLFVPASFFIRLWISMLTKLSKIMVVFVTAASVAALGVAVAIVNSGPSWTAEAAVLADYDFSVSGGEKPTWTAKHRTGEQALKTSPVQPEVIGAAFDDAAKRTKEEADKITPLIEPTKQAVATAQQFIEVDMRGLDARRKQLLEQMAAINKELADTALATNRAGEETLKIRGEAERRRSDVYRLTRNLQAIEADHFQLVEQKRRLLDMIFQMQGLRDRMKERSEDLAKETAAASE